MKVLRIFKIIKEKRRDSKVLENAAFLLGLQIANYIFPIVTIPYLVRVLGINKFGLIAFAIAFVQYFVIFTDYGFNLTATRNISLCRNNLALISLEFWTVYLIKAGMMVISIAIFICTIFFVPKFHVYSDVYLCCLLAVVGNFLFPVWYFQGIEKMKFISIINIVAKLIFTLAIFIFVKTSNDYLIAVLLQAGGVVFAGILAIFIVIVKYPIRFIMPTRESYLKSIKDGWPVFTTIMSATLVNNTNIFILGIYADTTTVGLFAIAEKIVRVAINIISPINTAIFPKVGKLFNENKEEGMSYLKRILRYGSALFMLLCFGLLIFADLLVWLVSGQSNKAIASMVRIMSIVPLSIFVDNIYGTQILVNIGKSKEFMKAVLIPGIISVICSVLFVPVWKGYATSVIFTLTEFMILIFMAFYVEKSGYHLLFNKRT